MSFSSASSSGRPAAARSETVVPPRAIAFSPYTCTSRRIRAVWPSVAARGGPSLGSRMSAPLRVMLVDDHEVVRQGIRSLLEATPDFEVVAEAGSVREAISGAALSRPDVVVMDVRLADGSGI